MYEFDVAMNFMLPLFASRSLALPGFRSPRAVGTKTSFLFDDVQRFQRAAAWRCGLRPLDGGPIFFFRLSFSPSQTRA